MPCSPKPTFIWVIDSVRVMNRIATERKRFNEMAQEYNTYIRKFPQRLEASIFGFDSKPYFKAEEGAEKAPSVKF